MIFLQSRRTRSPVRVIIGAAVIVCCVVYLFYTPRSSETVTWQAPFSDTSVQSPKSTKEPRPKTSIQDSTRKTSILSPEIQSSAPPKVIWPETVSLASSSSSETVINVRPTAVPSPGRPSHSQEIIALPEKTSSENSTAVKCISYEKLQRLRQPPFSGGKRQFPYSRPPPQCRTFNLPSMEKLIGSMNETIKDPDLSRLFENSYPNTLDTMIKWRGYAMDIDPITNNETLTDQELTYVITGDIDAMWLRDSASQIYSYLPLLEASADPDSLASLWRGLINIQARYIIISPYCHSFQPPRESRIRPTTNGAYRHNKPNPPYDPSLVFDCKWELDSLASFLQISTAYYQRTHDLAFFNKYNWVSAVEAAINAAGAMRLGTYSKEGKVEKSAWTFTGWTNRGSETLTNEGLGNPIQENGMVRSAFRPSDDACIYQFLVPSNMMWAKYLEEASFIMERLNDERAANLTTEMRDFAYGIRKGIDKDAIVYHRDFGDIFAYEVDGYGGVNLMDDANIPSLLSIPLFNYTHSSFPLPPPSPGTLPKNLDDIYKNTRNFVLSPSNPYFMRGPVLNAVGGPHLGPGKGWPMAAIVAALTARDATSESESEEEVMEQLRMVLDSTNGTGVVHESVNVWWEGDWSRAWFGWANGLLGELVLRLAGEDEGRSEGEKWLGRSFQ